MKRHTLLALGGAAGAVALALSPLIAADATPAPSPAAAQDAVKPGKDDKKGPHRFGGPERFRGPRGDRGCWGKGDFGRRDHRGGGLEMLNLTEDQKAKVKEVMDANRPKIEAIRKEQEEKIRAVMEESQKQIRPILTPDQQQVFDDAQKLREDGQKLREAARKLKKDKADAAKTE